MDRAKRSGISPTIVRKDPFCEYIRDIAKASPVTGWTGQEDEDYLIHDILAFRYFSLYLSSRSTEDTNFFQFWNEVYDIREIEDVSCRLVRSLSLIENYVLPEAQQFINLPQEKADALKAYYKKYSSVAEKIKKGGSIRIEDQNKVADSRPLFTSLQSLLFDRLKDQHWKKFIISPLYDEFKKKEKKEVKKKDRNIIIPPVSPNASKELTRSSSNILADFRGPSPISADPDFVTPIPFEPENISTKLVITRTPLEEIMENWEHRLVFDFYVQRVLKRGRAPTFYHLVMLGQECKDRRALLQVARSLKKIMPDIGLSSQLAHTLTRIVESNAGVMASLFGPLEEEMGELLPLLAKEVYEKIETYYPKFLTSRPHALFLHLKILYSQLSGILIWARDWALVQGETEKLQVSTQLCLHFLNFFEQFGVDEFYSKQASKLKKELAEPEQRMSVYCTLNIFVQRFLPGIKAQALSYICTKSPNIRYVISLLKVMLKGLKENQAQSAVELPFIIKSQLSLGVPISPIHFVGILETKNAFRTLTASIGVLTTTSFMQYEQGGTTSKRKIPFNQIKSVVFSRDKKGLMTGPDAPLGFTIDTGSELMTFVVPAKRDRALWLLGFYTIRKNLVSEKFVPFLYEHLQDNFTNEEKLLQAMEDACRS